MVQINLFAKQKERHRQREKMYIYGQVEEGWDGMRDWDWHIYATMYKKTTNENQLCSTEFNALQ